MGLGTTPIFFSVGKKTCPPYPLDPTYDLGQGHSKHITRPRFEKLKITIGIKVVIEFISAWDLIQY
jgi:hypothetical protein